MVPAPCLFNNERYYYSVPIQCKSKNECKTKKKGYIVKSGRRRLDAIPLVDPHREAVTPIAHALSQFQKSVQNSRQKLHSLQEEPQLVATPPSPFPSKSQRYFIHLLREH